ncbi:BTBD17 [Branchiostoma lanceolatum]|uniref:BTBD17 protein n=1 Tax=Branchiostoma lanceolatum TaxID=7740 RepID=A0A8K0EV46_BRALA|nr:BTBD17 [Branchiostoma lanceolatum]
MAMATPDSTSPSAEVTSTQSRPSTAADSAISETFDDQDGTLCYGDERQALTDYTKFFNNTSMSDVKLRVGDITYHAHKMVLIRSSDVFDRMLSGEWSDSARKAEAEDMSLGSSATSSDADTLKPTASDLDADEEIAAILTMSPGGVLLTECHTGGVSSPGEKVLPVFEADDSYQDTSLSSIVDERGYTCLYQPDAEGGGTEGAVGGYVEGGKDVRKVYQSVDESNSQVFYDCQDEVSVVDDSMADIPRQRAERGRADGAPPVPERRSRPVRSVKTVDGSSVAVAPTKSGPGNVFVYEDQKALEELCFSCNSSDYSDDDFSECSFDSAIASSSTFIFDEQNQEVELVEPYECIEVFPRFLKFLYGCHVVLNRENALPVLVLADKYNVADLRQVCIRHAVKQIIPKLQLKEVFHVWFQYATKCYHKPLISACVQSLAGRMDDIMSSDEWEQEWTNLDQDQLVEFLCSSDLRIKDEFELFRAVERWLNATSHPERRENLEVRLKVLLQHIRFPMMAPEQLCEVEMSKLVHQFPHLFVTLLLQAYKFHCLPLTGRAANKDFRTSNYLLRNYTALGWNHRVVIRGFHELAKNCELTSRFQTRASAYPQTVWDWELKIFPKGATNFDEFRAVLQANLILDQCRPIEFYISLVDNDQILRAVAGRKNFTKSRYTADTEIEKAVALAELNAPDSELLCGENVILQIMIRPVQ